jgi:hypothetical protein
MMYSQPPARMRPLRGTEATRFESAGTRGASRPTVDAKRSRKPPETRKRVFDLNPEISRQTPQTRFYEAAKQKRGPANETDPHRSEPDLPILAAIVYKHKPGHPTT